MNIKTGLNKCPNWLKKKYRDAVNHTCQSCHNSEEIVGLLSPHRIKRGINGGLYTLVPLNSKENNVKIVCINCHKKYHANEFKQVKSK